jgi:hypothetical protein
MAAAQEFYAAVNVDGSTVTAIDTACICVDERILGDAT